MAGLLRHDPCTWHAGCAEVGVQGEVALYNPKNGQRKTFSFDKAFGEGSDQVSVYEDTKALIRSVLDGEPYALREALPGLDRPGVAQGVERSLALRSY